jgi:ABC-2 type transport system permease protein
VIVFGVLFGVITSALMLAREQTSGTLQRIRLSRASAAQVLGGITLANLALALVQVPITFLVALAFGFRSPGSLWLGIGLALLLSLAATGCGFISACFSHSEGEATFIGTGVMVPLVFLSGAIFPMPPANLFSAAGRTVQVYDMMPSTHAADAMRRVLLFGDSLAEIPYQAAMLAGLSLLLLGLGAWFYQHKVLNDGVKRTLQTRVSKQNRMHRR